VQGSVTAGEIIHTLGWYKDSSNIDNLIIGAYNKIYKDAGAGGSPSLITSLLVDAQKGSIAKYGKHMMYVDGSNGNYKYDGTNWLKLGIAAPGAAPTVAVNAAAGNLNGTYIYRYVYVYKNGSLGYESESRWSEYSAEVVPANEQVDVDVVASTDSQVTNIRIYRISSVSVEWRMVVELANTTATYTDNIAEDSLGDEINYPYEGEPLDKDLNPVMLDGIIQWRDRLWGWDESYLYFTREGYPEKWINDTTTLVQPFNIAPSTGEKIVAAIPFKNLIVVFTDDDMFLVTGDAEPFRVIDYRNNLGCVAPRSPAVCDGRLFWLSKDGVQAWDGVGKPVWISEPIDTDYEGNGRGLLDTPVVMLHGAVGNYVISDNAYWLSVPFAGGASNTRTFTFDLKVAGVTRLSAWNVNNFGYVDAVVSPDRDFYTGEYSNDYILELTGTQDKGTDVTAFLETRHTDYGSDMLDKEFYELDATGYTSGDPIEFQTIVDLGAITDPVFLTSGGAKWGTAIWGTSKWGGVPILRYTNSYPQEICGTTFGYKIIFNKNAYFNSFEVVFQAMERMYTT